MSATTDHREDLWVCHLGTVGYRDALKLQERLRSRRQAGELADTLLLLEHPPVYTRGRRAGRRQPGGADDLPFAASFYRERGIDLVDSDRGGRITYHGPGQLVGYPVMGVADVGRFVRTMEAAIVDALAAEGLDAHARPLDGPDYTGVWVGAEGASRPAQQRKIASIGVHVQRGVATHGFAVNVVNDLAPFDWIVACGLHGVRMTSLAKERPGPVPGAGDAAACATRLRCFRRRVADSFCSAHDRRQRLVTPQALERALAAPARSRDPSGRAVRRAPLTTVQTRIEPVPA